MCACSPPSPPASATTETRRGHTTSTGLRCWLNREPARQQLWRSPHHSPRPSRAARYRSQKSPEGADRRRRSPRSPSLFKRTVLESYRITLWSRPRDYPARTQEGGRIDSPAPRLGYLIGSKSRYKSMSRIHDFLEDGWHICHVCRNCR